MASRVLSVVIAGDASRARREMKSVEDSAGTMQQKLAGVGRSMTAAGGILTAGFTVPVVAGLAAATKAAAEDEKAQALLAQTLKNSGFSGQIPGIEDFITKTQNATGVLDDELRPAFAKLIQAGRTPQQAMAELATALDIAAARGKPLDAVVTAMGKAARGSVDGLARMGLATKDAAGNTLTYEQALAAAAKTMGGSAARAASTTEGRARVMKARFADLSETIGAELLPAVTAVADFLSKMAGKFSTLNPGLKKFIIVIGLVVAALGPLLVMLGSIVTAVAAIGLPVIAVAAGVALLAAEFVIAYKKVGWFHDAVNAVARGMKRAFESVVSWFRENWPTISATLQEVGELIKVAVQRIQDVIAPVVLTIRALWRQFGDDIMAVAAEVWKRIGETVKNGVEYVRSIVRFVTALLKGDWSGAWQAIKDGMKAVLGQIGNIVSGALAVLQVVWRAAWGAMRDFAAGIWEKVTNAARTAFRGVVGFIVDAINRAIGVVNVLIRSFNRVNPFADVPEVPTLTDPFANEALPQRPTRDPDRVGAGPRGNRTIAPIFNITTTDPHRGAKVAIDELARMVPVGT